MRQKARDAFLARQRAADAVPEADFVVVNPTHYAVAILYDRERIGLPVVTAKGEDDVALFMRALARRHDVPVVPDPPLARMLHADLNVGEPIERHH